MTARNEWMVKWMDYTGLGKTWANEVYIWYSRAMTVMLILFWNSYSWQSVRLQAYQWPEDDKKQNLTYWYNTEDSYWWVTMQYSVATMYISPTAVHRNKLRTKVKIQYTLVPTNADILINCLWNSYLKIQIITTKNKSILDILTVVMYSFFPHIPIAQY